MGLGSRRVVGSAALLAVAALCVSLLLCRQSLFSSHVFVAGNSQGGSPLGAHPHVVGPKSRVLIGLTGAEAIQQVFVPTEGPRPMSVSYFTHLLRLHGLDATFSHSIFPNTESILQLLLDATKAEAYFGEPFIVRSPSGIRFLTGGASSRLGPSAESHRDQCLAALAELGIPASYPIQFQGQVLHVQDVLNDSLQNFHLQQSELEWTAVAYSLYLPPRRNWTNRFGEQFTFDDLANRLLDRPLYQGSCGGTHVIYALTILLRVDRNSPVLSPAVRAAVFERLSRCASMAVSRQHREGYWSEDWHVPLQPEGAEPIRRRAADSNIDRLTCTGHLAEWLLYLPDDLEIPDDVLSNAATWLKSQCQTASPADIQAHFCPYAHAIAVLKNVAVASADNAPVQSVP